MAANLEKLAKEWRDKYPQIADGLSNLAITARKLGAPESFSLATPEAPFKIPTASKEQCLKTREALAKEGFTFVVAVSPKSIIQLVVDEATAPLFDYINPSARMRSNVPPHIEVVIDPNNFKIEGSNNLSTDDQFEKIREREAILKDKLPKDVADIISMLRPKHASIPVQLDFAYQQRTGKVLFTNWFGRTDDKTVPGIVAGVGRIDPTSGLNVSAWGRDRGDRDVFAFSAVVLPRELIV